MTQFKVDFNDFKRRDNTNLMEITLYKDNGEQITPNRDHQWSGKALKFGDGDKRLEQELVVTIDGDKIGVPSKQLENLPSGDYGLELWEVNNDSKTIYPSAGFIAFHIHRNADESLESVTPTTDINKVINDLHEAGLNVVVDDIEMLAPDATPSVTSEVRNGKNHIKLHIPRGLDNANLTTAPAFVNLQTRVDNSAVGTNLIVQSDLKPGFLDRNSGSSNTIGAYDFHSDNYIPTSGATVFTFSSPDYAFKGSVNSALTMYDSDKNYLGYQNITSATQTLSKSNVAYIKFSINYVLEGGTDNNLSDWLNNHRYKLEKGSVATDWCLNPSEILTQADYAKIQAAIVALGGSLS